MESGCGHHHSGPDTLLPVSAPDREDTFSGTHGPQLRGSPLCENDALVYGIPWRYWDTYKAREFDNTMSYYQWSTRMPDAKWHDLRITTEIDKEDPNIVIHALVRVDGKGE